ncbi:MAG TPA: hypothetical protein VJ829_07400, partial [Candidatus Binatia bacterium]|nr:hypothetical protein [Candidatus Binatia bacterium]
MRKQVVKKQRKAAPAAATSGKRMVAPARTRAQPPPEPAPPLVAPPIEAMLDGAVDSLRRLLGELLEQRLESVAREVAEVRREVAGGADGERVLALLDDLLHALGANG